MGVLAHGSPGRLARGAHQPMKNLTQSHVETGLWDTFHDAELLTFEEVSAARLISITMKADFPCPPAGAGQIIGLDFAGVRSLLVLQWEPPRSPRPSNTDHAAHDDWLAKSRDESIRLTDLLSALADDHLFVSIAGYTDSDPFRFVFEGMFANNDLGYTIVIIEADSAAVTAAGRPSSFAEWLEWGTASWEEFGK